VVSRNSIVGNGIVFTETTFDGLASGSGQIFFTTTLNKNDRAAMLFD
jgi:hypothetical protein